LAASYFNVGLCSERAYERNSSHYGRVEVTTVSDFGNVNCRHVKARKVGDYLLKLKSCFVFRRQPAASSYRSVAVAAPDSLHGSIIALNGDSLTSPAVTPLTLAVFSAFAVTRTIVIAIFTISRPIWLADSHAPDTGHFDANALSPR